MHPHNPRASLIPGYIQVESFGDDDEYEDEEVSYVTLDLGGAGPTPVPSASTYHLIVCHVRSLLILTHG
jgi:general transcription factor 3C polypeptide 6